MKANEVMRIGRKRARAASSAASIIGLPSNIGHLDRTPGAAQMTKTDAAGTLSRNHGRR
jgi:hypothetical protein